MFRRILIFSFLLYMAGLLAAQTSAPPPAASGKAPRTKQSKPAAPVQTEFSEEVARQLLGRIRDGLQGHNPRLMLSAFSRDEMDGYFAMEDRLYSYFNRYDNIRAYFQILQSSTEKDRGVALAEWQIEATPPTGLPDRREGQVRFEFVSGKKGWQIVNLTPRNFFQ